MSIRRNQAWRISALTLALGTIAGCAAPPMGPMVRVLPGPGKSFDAFQYDQATCKNYASDEVRGQAKNANQRAVGTAALGTVLGAGVGALLGSVSGHAGAGAVIGAGAGLGSGTIIGAGHSGNEQYRIQRQYDNAYAACMDDKGNDVPGFERR